jgi:hypothetical protein
MNTESEAAVRHICMAHRWKVLSRDQTKIEVFPNSLLSGVENGVKYGALQAARKASTSMSDWAVSAGGLNYLLAATQAGRVNVGVVLLYDEQGRFFACKSIEEVMQNLEGVEPRFGRYGEFYWLNGEFRHANRYMTNATDAEAF